MQPTSQPQLLDLPLPLTTIAPRRTARSASRTCTPIPLSGSTRSVRRWRLKERYGGTGVPGKMVLAVADAQAHAAR